MKHISVLYYIINRRWMTKRFDSFTEAYNYSIKRMDEPNFKFRKIVAYEKRGGDYTLIDNLYGRGYGYEVSSKFKFRSTDQDLNDLLASER